MRQRHRLLALLSATVATLSVACSSSQETDPVGTDEGATTLDPTGTDAPGKLVVVAPSASTPLEPVKVKRPTRAAPVNLGQPLDAVPVGRQTFSVVVEGAMLSFQTTDAAEIKSSQTTTVKAALLAVRATGGPRTLGLDGDLTRWGIEAHAPMPRAPRKVQGSVKPASDGSRSAVVLAGDYEINYGVGGVDGAAVKLAPGDVKTISLSDPAGRRVTRIKAPIRALPNAFADSGGGEIFTVTLAGDLNGNSFSSVTLDDGEEIDVGVSPGHEGAAYTFRHIGWREPIALPLGQRGAGPLKWELGRIDVKDVLVNGTTTVRGTYQIFQANAQGQANGPAFVRGKPATNTGVDVPPGKYRVEVTYATAETGPKVDVHVIDVP